MEFLDGAIEHSEIALIQILKLNRT